MTDESEWVKSYEPPDLMVEPRSIDEARYQLVRELDEALHGTSFAQPYSPAEVWRSLLAEVSSLVRGRV